MIVEFTPEFEAEHIECRADLAAGRRAFDDMVSVDVGKMEREAAGMLAFELAQRIEPSHRAGCFPYCDRRGVVHTTLYEILDAIAGDVLGAAA